MVRIFSKLLTALVGLLALVPATSAFTNPIRNPGGSDPFMVYTGGYYYLMTTTWTDVQMARATTIKGLKTAPKKESSLFHLDCLAMLQRLGSRGPLPRRQVVHLLYGRPDNRSRRPTTARSDR